MVKEAAHDSRNQAAAFPGLIGHSHFFMVEGVLLGPLESASEDRERVHAEPSTGVANDIRRLRPLLPAALIGLLLGDLILHEYSSLKQQ